MKIAPLVLVLALAAPLALAQTVVLVERATSPNAYVALAEVAEVRGADPGLAAKFAEIYLGPVPGTYDQDAIRARMRRYGFDPATLRFEGAMAVRVERGPALRQPETLPVSAGDQPPRTFQDPEALTLVGRAVEDHVRQWVSERVDDASVEVEEIAWTGGEPGSDRIARAWVLEGAEAPGHRVRFSVQVRTERGRLLSASVLARVRYYVRQVVARADLPRGRILGPSDLSSQIATVTDPGKEIDLPLAPESLVGRRLARSVSAGDPIGTDLVEDVPVVKRGEKVRMIYRGSGFVIEAFGRAEGDASLGAWVMVKNLNSKKEIRARAIGPAVVEVSSQDSGR